MTHVVVGPTLSAIVNLSVTVLTINDQRPTAGSQKLVINALIRHCVILSANCAVSTLSFITFNTCQRQAVID